MNFENFFLVREATVADANGIAKVHVKTWQHAYKGLIPDSYLQSLDIKQRTERWKSILSNDEVTSSTFVAVNDGEVLGFCSVSQCRDEDMDPEIGEVLALYVDVTKMGKGVGTALLQRATEHLTQQGHKKATLWVITSNEKTRRWYESKGWTVEGKTKTEKSKGFDIDETRYIRKLKE